MSIKAVAAMKSAMIKKALSMGYTDSQEIAEMADQAGLECSPMSVAGVKAEITKGKIRNILCRRR